MDFFEHQDVARKKTGQMVFLFVLAVIAIVVALNAVFAGLYIYGIGELSQRSSSVPLSTQFDTIPPGLWLAVTGISLLIILGGSTFRILQLGEGGEAVARMVGARKISRGTTDPKEKQLLNVVDEMAIASGVSVPQVFVMDDEPAINAFAAGYKPSEAIVAVTRGTLEQLDRDELQGVIAHEFSHIFNGDMRLNIRLMGVLYGILIIGALGGYLLRSMRYSSRSSRDGKGAGAVLIIGLALFVIGYTGVFFGRLIKAGVSRQREFLADSSAVQFTRNPEGITNALKKIGKLDEGSLIHGEHAEELSHMYFGQGIQTAMSGLLATHPPLMDRIKRINKGRVPLTSPGKRRKMHEAMAANMAEEQASVATAAVEPGSVAESIGNPSNLHMIYAASLLASIPQPVSDSLALAKGSKALMYALILDEDTRVREHEMKVFRQTAHKDLESEVLRLAGHLDKLHDRYRLPLFDLAVSTLKDLSAEERQALIEGVRVVIDADRRIKLEEMTIYILMRAHLGERAGEADRVRYRMIADLKDEVELLLSLLAYLGKSGQHSPQMVFDKAASELSAILSGLNLVELKRFNPDDLVLAMEKFVAMSPALKERLTAACIAAVMADETVTIKELEVMRGLCASMEVPMPPVLVDGAD